MNVGDAADVACPCCGKVLYKLYAQQRGREAPIFLVLPGSQDMQEDKDGHFLRCVHCKKRIAMLPDPSHPDSGFIVSPVQDCGA
jgi:DNA-directed RNA polymerase subunit RPC12/RpoP